MKIGGYYVESFALNGGKHFNQSCSGVNSRYGCHRYNKTMNLYPEKAAIVPHFNHTLESNVVMREQVLAWLSK